MTIVATPRTLKFIAQNEQIAVSYEETGRFNPAELTVPLSLFDDCAGSRTDLVQIVPGESGGYLACWDDAGIEQRLAVEERPLPDTPDSPALPKQLTENPSSLLKALRDASNTTDTKSSRYALGCIQLRGKRGEIAATDGHQMLLQRGFEFPFEEELLIDCHQVFQSSELRTADHVGVGLQDNWFTVRAGNWTVQIKVETEGRFPRVDDVIPPVQRAIASCRISSEDALVLVNSLPKLPSKDEQNSPVTIRSQWSFFCSRSLTVLCPTSRNQTHWPSALRGTASRGDESLLSRACGETRTHRTPLIRARLGSSCA